MDLKKQLFHFFIIYIPFVLLDFTWFGIIVSEDYQKNIGHLISGPDDITTGTFVCMFLVLALMVLGAFLFLTPRLKNTSYPESFFWGTLYGLVTYGVYALSNFTHFKGWPLHIMLYDTAWGLVVGGFLGIALHFLNRNERTS